MCRQTRRISKSMGAVSKVSKMCGPEVFAMLILFFYGRCILVGKVPKIADGADGKKGGKGGHDDDDDDHLLAAPGSVHALEGESKTDENKLEKGQRRVVSV
jgi:hypothetical protein